MSEHEPMLRDDAARCARFLEDQLGPHCHRFVIAGSIRRGKSMVRDIEIVCEPIAKPGDPDMFGESRGVRYPLRDAIASMHGAEWLRLRYDSNGRGADGLRHKRLELRSSVAHGGRLDVPAWIPVDLFCVLPPAQWGWILTLRTGPGDFSKHLVTQRHKRGGMPDSWHSEKGRVVRATGETVPMDDERAVFDALGLPYLEPDQREHWRITAAGRRALEGEQDG